MTASGPIRIGRSLQWLLPGRAIQTFVQLAGVAILARLLAPEDFGLIALAGVVIALVQTFLDMGTGAALIQRRKLENRHANAVFWFNVCVGLLLASLLIVISPVLSQWLGDIRLIPVLNLLSVSFPMATLGTTHAALLERDANFRTLMICTTISAIAGLVAAVALALCGAGVYALVGQSLVMTAISTLTLWLSSRWRPGRPSISGLSDIASFSGNFFFFNLLNYAHRNVDTVIIGRVFGQQDLGLYNIAYRVLLFPIQNITFAISRALLPAYSRTQLEPDVLASHYIVTLRGIALITAPLMAAIWAVREPMVSLLLGPAWARSIDVIQWLAPVGFLQSIVSTSGSVLAAQGRTDALRTLGVVGVPFLTASFIFGIPWGIEGVAASYCLANIIWLFPVLMTVMKIIHGSFAKALIAVSLPAVIAVTVFVGSYLVFHTMHLPSITRFALVVSSGSFLYVLSIRFFLWDSVFPLLSEFWNLHTRRTGGDA